VPRARCCKISTRCLGRTALMIPADTGFPALPLLASRGCARRCSFCSIHTFYRTARGKVVRVRAADQVVEEMCMLYDERGVRVYLFQDDDFPLWGEQVRNGRQARRRPARLRTSG